MSTCIRYVNCRSTTNIINVHNVYKRSYIHTVVVVVCVHNGHTARHIPTNMINLICLMLPIMLPIFSRLPYRLHYTGCVLGYVCMYLCVYICIYVYVCICVYVIIYEYM